jgi:hypothetical protein
MLTVLVVYESMFGATRRVAEAIAEGAAEAATVQVRRADAVRAEEVAAADVLIVGAPTHAHALPRPESRRTAEEWGRDEARHLRFEADPAAVGVRELLKALPPTTAVTVAFDTRADMPEVFSGSAARGIAKRLRKLGLRSATGPQSFLVGKTGTLLDGELEHAWHFGHSIAAAARRGADADAVPA